MKRFVNKKINSFIEENESQQVELLKELCAIPAPSHKEDARAEFCKNWFVQIGARDVYIDGAKNVVVPIGCANSNAITVIVAHTDTVFPDLEPMPFKEDGDILRCPGIGDNTASLVALMLTVKFFLQNGITPKDGVLFVCNACEEGLGNLKGTREIFNDYAGRIKQFISFDGAPLYRFDDRCVGSHRYHVTVETEGGHSYSRVGNETALHRLAEIIGAIYGIEVPQVEGSRTTYNVGTVSGGTSVNTIAQKAEMLCEYRSDNVECLQIMRERFEKIFHDADTEKVRVTAELIGERPCAKGVDPESMKTLSDTCAGVLHDCIDREAEFSSASTDCNIPLSLGIPAICVAVYDGGGAHTREEWLKKSSLPIGLQLGICYALKLTDSDY